MDVVLVDVKEGRVAEQLPLLVDQAAGMVVVEGEAGRLEGEAGLRVGEAGLREGEAGHLVEVGEVVAEMVGVVGEEGL